MTDGTYKLGSCRDCGKLLTLEEDHYYEYRCEDCEGKWHHRIRSWAEGAEDKELDELYGY